MKRIFFIPVILGLAVLFTSAISIMELPQDPPKTQKAKTHIKLVKVKDGEKVELDTVIEANEILVWNDDTVGGAKSLNFISEDLDSLLEGIQLDFDIDIDEDGEGNVIIIRGAKGEKPIVKEFKINGNHKMFFYDDIGENEIIVHAPSEDVFPHPAHPSKFMFFGKDKKENSIDLSSPSIISYKKKKMKDGKEKITIIRKVTQEQEIEALEEIHMHGEEHQPMIFHRKVPKGSKKIKIIKTDDGSIDILRDANVWTIEEGDVREKVIEEDGKVIHIREVTKDDEKQVEVKVEVEEEIEKQEKEEQHEGTEKKK